MFTISVNPLIVIGPFIFRWVILIILIAIGIGVWITAREAERRGIRRSDVYEVAIWIVVGGLIGARLFYVIDLWSFEFSLNPAWSLNIFQDWGFDIWSVDSSHQFWFVGNVVGVCPFSWMQQHQA